MLSKEGGRWVDTGNTSYDGRLGEHNPERAHTETNKGKPLLGILD